MDYSPIALSTPPFERQPILDDITVVIPTLGRDLLQECLAWIAHGSAWPAQVIVVDQGNNPAVNGWLEQLTNLGIQTEYVASAQRGRAAGVNRGSERVRTRFVVITDDDCFADHDWLRNMAQRLRETPDRIITGRVEPVGEDESALSLVTSRVPQLYTHPMLRVQPLIGGNMGAAMTTINRIGHYDEHPSIHSAEDSDWGYRALRLGVPIAYDPDSMVRHYNWRNPGQRSSRLRQYALTQGAFYGKYLLNGDPLVLLQTARDLVRAPIRWVRGTIQGDADVAASGRADTLYLLPGIIAGLRRRNIDQPALDPTHKTALRGLAQQLLPLSTRRKLTHLTRWPPIGFVRWGSLRRVRPIDPDWGLSRGTPIDRYYIQKFLQAHAADVQGRVLEIADNSYTRFYGGDRVTVSDVLHVSENNPGVTIIGDLSDGSNIASDTYDCIILTQTLQTIYDLPATIKTLYRILKPGGVVLATVPGISKVARYDMDHWGYYWTFSSMSARRLFATVFEPENVTIKVQGNVLAAVAFLHGLALSEVRKSELDYFDRDYEMTIGVRAVKR